MRPRVKTQSDRFPATEPDGKRAQRRFRADCGPSHGRRDGVSEIDPEAVRLVAGSAQSAGKWIVRPAKRLLPIGITRHHWFAAQTSLLIVSPFASRRTKTPSLA